MTAPRRTRARGPRRRRTDETPEAYAAYLTKLKAGRERQRLARQSATQGSGVASTPPDPEPIRADSGPPPNSGPSGQIDPDRAADLHDMVLMAVHTVSLLLPAEKRPNETEIELITRPAERILLRHASLPSGINPDYADAAALAFGVFVYADRIGAFQRRPRAARAPQPGPTGPAGAPASPAPPPNGHDGGLDAADLQARFDTLRATLVPNGPGDARRGAEGGAQPAGGDYA